MADHDSPGDDRRRPDDEAKNDEAPPVAPMASTYGTSLIESDEEARRVASEAPDDDQPPRDGLGNPPSRGQHSGQS